MSERKPEAPPKLDGEVHRWQHDGCTFAIDSEGRAWCWLPREGEWNHDISGDTFAAQFLAERARAERAEAERATAVRELGTALRASEGAVLAEREACAAKLDDMAARCVNFDMAAGYRHGAKAIRARGGA